MYETMRVWDTYDPHDLPEVERGFAEAWQATDKVVYSTTLDNVPEPRTRLERTFDPEVVQTMKENADRDLSIAGADLAAQAIRAGLVDRYQLRVVPVIVGGGIPALPKEVRIDLVLNTTRRFDDGSVLLDYSLSTS
jgi:dihydrofolate reductase